MQLILITLQNQQLSILSLFKGSFTITFTVKQEQPSLLTPEKVSILL